MLMVGARHNVCGMELKLFQDRCLWNILLTAHFEVLLHTFPVLFCSSSSALRPSVLCCRAVLFCWYPHSCFSVDTHTHSCPVPSLFSRADGLIMRPAQSISTDRLDFGMFSSLLFLFPCSPCVRTLYRFVNLIMPFYLFWQKGWLLHMKLLGCLSINFWGDKKSEMV